jgi:hypothetical protein
LILKFPLACISPAKRHVADVRFPVACSSYVPSVPEERVVRF